MPASKISYLKHTQHLYYLQAARETGALKEAKDMLEKIVEELTYRVQLEKRLRVFAIETSFQSTFFEIDI